MTLRFVSDTSPPRAARPKTHRMRVEVEGRSLGCVDMDWTQPGTMRCDVESGAARRVRARTPRTFIGELLQACVGVCVGRDEEILVHCVVLRFKGKGAAAFAPALRDMEFIRDAGARNTFFRVLDFMGFPAMFFNRGRMATRDASQYRIVSHGSQKLVALNVLIMPTHTFSVFNATCCNMELVWTWAAAQVASVTGTPSSASSVGIHPARYVVTDETGSVCDMDVWVMAGAVHRPRAVVSSTACFFEFPCDTWRHSHTAFLVATGDLKVSSEDGWPRVVVHTRVDTRRDYDTDACTVVECFFAMLRDAMQKRRRAADCDCLAFRIRECEGEMEVDAERGVALAPLHPALLRQGQTTSHGCKKERYTKHAYDGIVRIFHVLRTLNTLCGGCETAAALPWSEIRLKDSVGDAPKARVKPPGRTLVLTAFRNGQPYQHGALKRVLCERFVHDHVGCVREEDVGTHAARVEEALERRSANEDAYSVYEEDVDRGTRRLMERAKLDGGSERLGGAPIGSAVDEIRRKSSATVEALRADFLSCNIYEPYWHAKVNG